MEPARWKLFIVLLLASLCVFTACSDDEDGTPYPSIITEMVIIRMNSSMQVTIQTDKGAIYNVTNKVEGMAPNSIGRMMCGYLPDGKGGAHIYKLERVTILKDLTTKVSTPVYDPVGIVSRWQEGKFINLHILPKTKSDPSKHTWGFIRTGQHPNAAGGTTHELSVHHHQNGDALAYSSDYYLTLVIDSVSKTFSDKDSIDLTLQGFDNSHTWRYGKQKQ